MCKEKIGAHSKPQVGGDRKKLKCFNMRCMHALSPFPSLQLPKVGLSYVGQTPVAWNGIPETKNIKNMKLAKDHEKTVVWIYLWWKLGINFVSPSNAFTRSFA